MKLEQFATALQFALADYPGFVSVIKTDNIWECVEIRITKEKKEDWPNGIFYNSNYLLVLVGGNGQTEDKSTSYKMMSPTTSWKQAPRAKKGDLESILKYLVSKIQQSN